MHRTPRPPLYRRRKERGAGRGSNSRSCCARLRRRSRMRMVTRSRPWWSTSPRVGPLAPKRLASEASRHHRAKLFCTKSTFPQQAISTTLTEFSDRARMAPESELRYAQLSGLCPLRIAGGGLGEARRAAGIAARGGRAAACAAARRPRYGGDLAKLGWRRIYADDGAVANVRR